MASPLRPAAGVIPIKTSPTRVFLVHRSVKGGFFPGFHAFPGGAQEKEDGQPAICAVRELFEETGLWPGPKAPSADERRALLDRKLPLSQLVERYPLDPDPLIPAGVRCTPDYSPVRFTAQFYLWDASAAGEADIWPGELESGRWWEVQEALQAWRANEIALAPPTQSALFALEQGVTQAADRLTAESPESGDPITISPSWAYLPLVTPTLPPARHTLCYLVGRCEDRFVIDPGSDDPQQLARLQQVLGDQRPQAVIFTHHHVDHVGGWRWAQQQGYPIWTHLATARLLPEMPVARMLDDGQILSSGDLQLTVLHTPGHAPGHIALWEQDRAILLAADLVSSISTILVAPPEGDMAQYLASLARCRALRPRLLLPSHGGPYGPGSDLLGKTLRHRLEREAKVMGGLDIARNLEDLLAVVYEDTAVELWPIARASLQAHLSKLEGEGRVRQVDGIWKHI